MAGGVSYHSSTISVGGSSKVDLITWEAALGGELLWNRADSRKYPQLGASVNHTATARASWYDLSNVGQSSTPIIGATVGTGGVVITATLNGAATTWKYTLNPATYTDCRVTGGHGNLAVVEAGFEAYGTSGSEPTVTWAVGA